MEHEKNCSTSTGETIGSAGTELFPSLAGAVAALKGPLHGQANQKVMEQLDQMVAEGLSCAEIVRRVESGEFRLFGFGHRVYKNFDPRATILEALCPKVLAATGAKGSQFELAQQLAGAALDSQYFKERNLYPNVDFYSGSRSEV